MTKTEKPLQPDIMNAEQEFDEAAETYDEGLEKLLGVWGKNNERFAEYKIQLLRLLIPGEMHSILDFGCGTGRSLGYLKQYYSGQKRPPALYGCDVSNESLKVAKAVLPEATIFSDDTTESLAKQRAEWDLVLLACVLHHIEPGERAMWMRAIAEKVAAGGYIAVFEHNLINPYTRKIVYEPTNIVDRPEYMLKQKQLVELLLGANPKLRLFWKGYTCFSPIRRKWVTAVERRLGWLPLGAQHCVIVKKTA